MSSLVYRPITPSDHEQFVRVEAEAFGVAPEDIRKRLASDLPDERRGLFLDGRIVAQLELYPLEVLTGMHALPFGGIDSTLSIFWGFLLVCVVLGVLVFVGRRRQKAARERAIAQRAG